MTTRPRRSSPVRSHAPRGGAAFLLVALALSGVPAARGAGQPADPRATPGIVPARDARVVQLLDEHVDMLLRQDPLGVGSALGDERYNDRLGDPSPQAVSSFLEEMRDRAARADAIDAGALSAGDALDLSLLRYQLRLAIDGAKFFPEQMPVATISGPQYWLPQMADQCPMRTPRHEREYLSRLEQVAMVLEGTTAQMRAGLAAGRVPPRVVVEPALAQALAQCSASIESSPRQSPFFRPFLGRPETDANAARAAAIIRASIVPAYRAFAAFLKDEYLPACRDTLGITQGVDGPAAYDYLVRAFTTLPLTADEVHDLGRREVARIRAEMMDAIARSDFAGKDSLAGDELFAAFVDDLRTNPRFYCTSAQELLDRYRAFAKLVDPELPRLFGRLPRLPYGVREIPRFAAPSSPTAFYYNGNLAAGIPGYFMANTHALDMRPTFDVRPLTLHEAVPGHHFQVAIAQELALPENGGLHPFRTLAGTAAFVEGWGLYAERLGLEMGERPLSAGGRGLYEDPYDDFGRLNYEIWRAMRLVVDTGLHTRGWTRQQAIDYMLANSASTRVDAENEVDRYIGWPGQALAYKIGELKIRELRARAERALGERFDVRAFHDTVLATGGVPLVVLEEVVDRWIAEQPQAR